MAPDFSSVQKVLSGRWTLNVLLAAESGGRFGELQSRLGPIARGTLSKELQTLTELELITKTPSISATNSRFSPDTWW